MHVRSRSAGHFGRVVLALALALALATGGCGGDGAAGEGGDVPADVAGAADVPHDSARAEDAEDADAAARPDAALPPDTAPPPDAPATPDTAPDAAAPDAGPDVVTPPGVRVWRLESGEPSPVGGPNAVGIAGDYVLENEVARFVVQGDNRARTWVPYTGSLVDADVVRAPGEEGRDNLQELSLVTAILRTLQPRSFEIVPDAEGAHLRVRGRDWGMPVIDQIVPLGPLGYEVRVDYLLRPGDPALEIATTIENPGTRRVDLGDGVIWGDRVRYLTPGEGWGRDAIATGARFPYQLAIAPGVAYALVPEEGPLMVPLADADLLPLVGKSVPRPDSQPVTYRRFLVVGRDLEAVRAWVGERAGEARAPLTVSVTLADPRDATEAAEAFVLDAEGVPVSQAFLPAEELVFRVVPGTYTVVLQQTGRPTVTSEPVTVGAEGAALALELPATGRVTFAVGGADHTGAVRAGLPCRIGIQPGLDAPAGAGVRRRVFTATGEGTFLLEPGDHTLVAARGYEYEVVRQSLTLAAGETVAFEGTLARVVDTTGWVASDLHMHSEASVDTTVAVEDRIVHLAAVGLERLPITDHDAISDLDAQVVAMGLGEHLRLSAGVEVSPLGRHSNTYPVTPRDDRPVYYGVPWFAPYDADGRWVRSLTFPEIWAIARADFAAGITQINHPREGQGFLDFIGYDPAVGLDSVAPGAIDANFDTIELINSGDVLVGLEQILPDWYSFLNQGWRKAGVGVSDSHSESNPGDARTWLYVGTDDPRAVSDEQFVAALTGLHAVAASGPFVEAGVAGAGIGETVHLTADDPWEVAVRVQAPSWMPVDWVRVVVDGETVAEEPAGTDGVVRFDAALPLPDRDQDFWVVVLAGAPDETMAPVSPGQRVLSIANPIFVDVDGDGWNPPPFVPAP